MDKRNRSNSTNSVKSALPSTSPFSSQPFKQTDNLPKPLQIQPPRRLSQTSLNSSSSPTNTSSTNDNPMNNLLRRFSFKGNNSTNINPSNNLDTIPAKQTIDQQSITSTSPPPDPHPIRPNRRKSDQKRTVSPMGERILRGSFDGNAF